MAFTMLSLTALVVGALLSIPLTRVLGPRAFTVLAVAPAVGLVGAASFLPSLLRGDTYSWSIPWIPQYGIHIGFTLTLFQALFALLVTGAGVLILLYCARYFHPGDTGLGKFGFVFLLFAASMLGLVLADDIFLMFVFWELTTVMSYLLVGHYGFRRASRSAASQALIITTLGGLAMFVGLIILFQVTGTSSLTEILAMGPQGTPVTVAVYLLLVGAITKSAIFPFHFWLPGAMAAPTPVSAYLHAAAMVKAGVYLVARLGPTFGDIPGYRTTLVLLGGFTMLLGAIRALRQYDLKLVLAFGTVSQLGMLVMLFGMADPALDVAATTLVFAHAVTKAPLFLSVGIIEHRTGTRDLRKITGLARAMPVLAVTATIATLSMIGFPPMIGFVAKEAALTELFLRTDQPLAVLVLVVFVIGSALTTAYMLRYLLGAFGNRSCESPLRSDDADHRSIQIPPAIFAAFALFGGVFAHTLDPVVQRVRDGQLSEHFALWHGVTPALLTTIGVLAVGALLVKLLGVEVTRLPEAPHRLGAGHLYFVTMRAFDLLAVKVTTFTQRGSLPFYLMIIFLVVIAGIGTQLVRGNFAQADTVLYTDPSQIVIAIVIIVAAIATLFASKRFQSVLLVGFTGYAIAALFGLHGAPDIAITQLLVETMTLVAFVLVIRRLPQGLKRNSRYRLRIGRLLLGSTLGLLMGVFVLVVLGARGVDPVSVFLPELAYKGGHGQNVVNVTLVDIRGWDTFGELSVVVAAATGIASLVYLSTRTDNLPRMSRRDARAGAQALLKRVADPNDPAERGAWLLAGKSLDPNHRSIILEVVVRLVAHALIMISLFLLLVGHNAPGGGFAAGLIAGVGLVVRYLAGGAAELGAAAPFDAGRVLGVGLIFAGVTAAAPLLFGEAALTSAWVDFDLGPFGELSLVSSVFFDIGVYLVVVGLVLDVLRSLGAQIDVHIAEEEGARA